MATHGKRDLLIHSDEDRNELIFFTVAVDDTQQIRATEFDGARIDIPLFLEMSAENAEWTLGETVFSTIEAFSDKKTGIRPYEEMANARHRQDVAEWKVAAATGNPEVAHVSSPKQSRSHYGLPPQRSQHKKGGLARKFEKKSVDGARDRNQRPLRRKVMRHLRLALQEVVVQCTSDLNLPKKSVELKT